MEPETIIKQALGDKYEIQSVIGKGGMATVYKAIQKSLNRPVALKIIHQNLVHDDEFIKRFIREAQVCASLNHPNILTVYDVGTIGTVNYMSMEYLEGMTLRDLIKSKGTLSADEASGYIIPIAEALDYMHREGIIHRDVKSSNIFITRSGRVLLMDFGIVFSDSHEALSQSGTMLGTPEYMSPEQAEGKLKIDGRSDIYSLGVVLFECLTGRLPFHSDNYISTLHHVLHDPPPTITSLNSKVPKWMSSIVASCLVKDRRKRMQSGSSLSAALKSRQLIKTISREDDYETQILERNKIRGKEGVPSKGSSSTERKKKWIIASLVTAICILLAAIYYLVSVSPGNSGRAGNIGLPEIQDTAILAAGNKASVNAGMVQLPDKKDTVTLASGNNALVTPTGTNSNNIKSIPNKKVAAAINEDERLAKVLSLVQQGDEYLGKDDPEKALTKYQEALKLAPSNNSILEKIVAATNARDKKLQDSLTQAENIAKKNIDITQSGNEETAVGAGKLQETISDDVVSKNLGSDESDNYRMRDADGNEYKTVKIGNQIWMAENLKTTKYNDGTTIRLVENDFTWSVPRTRIYCWYNNNSAANKAAYGALYTWYVVKTGKLCPTGWHVPTDDEWTALTTFLGATSIKWDLPGEPAGRTLWFSPEKGAKNKSIFSALPGGYRTENGYFHDIGTCYWWSSTEYSSQFGRREAWIREVPDSFTRVLRVHSAEQSGYSVRCIRDY